MVETWTLDPEAPLSPVYDIIYIGGQRVRGLGNPARRMGTEFLSDESEDRPIETTSIEVLDLPPDVEQPHGEGVGRCLLMGTPGSDARGAWFREVLVSLLTAQQPTEFILLACSESAREDDVDWDRWHDLLDIRDGRGLDPREQAEYDCFAKIVAKLDDEAAAVAAPAVEALVERHKRVLASLERLTEAVRAAADRT